MANAIRVTPDALEGMAGNVENWADSYRNLFTNILNTAEELQSTWGGEANQAYEQQIAGFQNDFENLWNLMNKYSSFLRTSAAKYRSAEETIKSNAASLSTGI